MAPCLRGAQVQVMFRNSLPFGRARVQRRPDQLLASLAKFGQAYC